MKNSHKDLCAFAVMLLVTGTLSACKPQAEPAVNAPPVAAAPGVPASSAPLEGASSAAVTAPEKPAAQPALASSPVSADGKLYTVAEGTRVDAKTLEGFRTWRAAACDRCHGANQEGMVGPSLIASLKTLSKDDFVKTLKEGKLEKGMPSWSTNENVMSNIDNLYAYLKGRSDGAITQARVTLIQ
jgi:mono/diheme cytochrome c family protein